MTTVDQQILAAEEYIAQGYKNKTQACINAGYSESYANAKQHHIVERGLQKLKQLEKPTEDYKIGLSWEKIAERVQYWATQEKDGRTALKAMEMSANMDHSVSLQVSDGDNKTVVPVQVNFGPREEKYVSAGAEVVSSPGEDMRAQQSDPDYQKQDRIETNYTTSQEQKEEWLNKGD